MKLNFNIQKVIGYILLTPSLLVVLVWFVNLYDNSHITLSSVSFQIGNSSRESFEGNFIDGYILIVTDESGNPIAASSHSSTIIICFGLMAIAGAYLIKDNSKIN
jgi:hypothetical protein